MRVLRLFIVGLTLSLLMAAPGALAQSASGGRSIATSQVSVLTAATITAIARAGRIAVTIQNHGTNNVYCSATSGVLTTTGFRLPGVDGASITIPTTAIVYCIAAGGAQTVSVLESY